MVTQKCRDARPTAHHANVLTLESAYLSGGGLPHQRQARIRDASPHLGQDALRKLLRPLSDGDHRQVSHEQDSAALAPRRRNVGNRLRVHTIRNQHPCVGAHLVHNGQVSGSRNRDGIRTAPDRSLLTAPLPERYQPRHHTRNALSDRPQRHRGLHLRLVHDDRRISYPAQGRSRSAVHHDDHVERTRVVGCRKSTPNALGKTPHRERPRPRCPFVHRAGHHTRIRVDRSSAALALHNEVFLRQGGKQVDLPLLGQGQRQPSHTSPHPVRRGCRELRRNECYVHSHHRSKARPLRSF
jgi:hypothetical protein